MPPVGLVVRGLAVRDRVEVRRLAAGLRADVAAVEVRLFEAVDFARVDVDRLAAVFRFAGARLLAVDRDALDAPADEARAGFASSSPIQFPDITR